MLFRSRKGLSLICNSQSTLKNQQGFSLLEVVLAVGILASISVFAITALSNQLEIRNRLSYVNEQSHSVHTAMSRIFQDIRHAHVYSKKDQVLSGTSSGPAKGRLSGKSDMIWFSTHSLRSLMADTPQSDVGFVKFVVSDDKNDSSRKQLVRVVDYDMNDSIERGSVGLQQVLVPDINEFSLLYWNGVDFTQEWDSDSSETSGKLPKMIKVKIAANMPLSDSDKQKRELNPNANAEKNVLALETIVYLMYSAGVADVKEPAKEFRWLP